MSANMKNVRTVTLAAALIALTIVADGALRIVVWMGLEVRFGFLFLAVIAYLFGPVAAFASGVITGMLAFLLFPTGFPFDPRFDLNSGLAGIIYAVFLYKRNVKSEYFIIWILSAKVAVNLICNIIINTYLLRGYMGSAAEVLTIARLFKNIVLLPVEIVLMFVIIKFVADYARRYKFLNGV